MENVLWKFLLYSEIGYFNFQLGANVFIHSLKNKRIKCCYRTLNIQWIKKIHFISVETEIIRQLAILRNDNWFLCNYIWCIGEVRRLKLNRVRMDVKTKYFLVFPNFPFKFQNKKNSTKMIVS